MNRLNKYKGLTLIVWTMLLLPTAMWAQSEGFTVAGDITFKKSGDLFVQILTEEQFNRNDGEEAEGDRYTAQLILKMSEQEQEQKKVSFEFTNIPQGTYAIRCFQDVNGNGKMDKGRFGPKEPWGVYRPKRPAFRAPRFEEIKFEVKVDMTDITFDVK